MPDQNPNPEQAFDEAYKARFDPDHHASLAQAPAREHHEVDYTFAGGLNTDSSPDHLQENEMRIADNIVLTSRGGARKRGGYQVLFEDEAAESITQIFEWVRKTGTAILMYVAENDQGEYHLKEYHAGSSEAVTQVYSDRLAYFVLRDVLYFLDGEDLYEYDGETAETVDTIRTETYEEQVLYIENADDGTFRLGFDEVDETGDLAWDVSSGDLKAAIEALAGIEHSVTVVKENGEYTITYDVDEGSVGLVITDNSLEHETELPYINIVTHVEQEEHEYDSRVSACRYAAQHSKSYRIFYAGDPEDNAALYYSEPLAPEHVEEHSVLYPASEEGPIKALAVFMDAVLVFYQHGIWMWRGIDPEIDAVWEKLPTSEGTVHDATVHLTTNTLTMLGPGGLYALSPNILGVPLNMQPGDNYILNLAQDRVMKVLDNVQNYNNVRATYDAYNERYLMTYDDGEEGTGNNRILVFDFRLGAFTRWTNIYAKDLCYRSNHSVVAAQGNTLIELDTGTQDGDTGPVTFTVLTKRYPLGAPFRNKKINRFYVAMENPQVEEYELLVQLIADDDVKREHIFEINPGPSLFTGRISTYEVGSRFMLLITDDIEDEEE